MDQIIELIKRLIYRVKQKETMEKGEPSPIAEEAPSGAKKENKKPELQPLAPVSFKSGKSLPSIIDVPKTTNAYDFPTLGKGLGKGPPALN